MNACIGHISHACLQKDAVNLVRRALRGAASGSALVHQSDKLSLRSAMFEVRYESSLLADIAHEMHCGMPHDLIFSGATSRESSRFSSAYNSETRQCAY